VKRAPQTSASPVSGGLRNLAAPSENNQPICTIVARNFHIHGPYSIVRVRQ
jgi:hypothetical protein